MTTMFLAIHFLVTGLLIIGILLQAAKGEGLGALGGGSEVFRGSSSKGFEGVLEKWTEYLAWTFLATSFLSAVLIPKFF